MRKTVPLVIEANTDIEELNSIDGAKFFLRPAYAGLSGENLVA
jgi:hypothetical protein